MSVPAATVAGVATSTPDAGAALASLTCAVPGMTLDPLAKVRRPQVGSRPPLDRPDAAATPHPAAPSMKRRRDQPAEQRAPAEHRNPRQHEGRHGAQREDQHHGAAGDDVALVAEERGDQHHGRQRLPVGALTLGIALVLYSNFIAVQLGNGQRMHGRSRKSLDQNCCNEEA